MEKPNTQSPNFHIPQKSQMLAILHAWSNVNTGSDNIAGIIGFCSVLKLAFSTLGGQIATLKLPPRQKLDSKGSLVATPTPEALHIIKRPKAKFKVLFGGHMDTVYPSTSNFQTVDAKDNEGKLRGPGVADMKGGLLIMLKGLEVFENSLFAKNIGWEILITPDEEIGSISSRNLWLECAKRCDIGIIFEPSPPDGSFVSERKGSMNLAVVMKGTSSHVGRDFSSGRNAITALSDFIVQAHSINQKNNPLILNIGCIEGGSASNIVADLAICKLNIRADLQEQMEDTYIQLENILESVSAKSETSFKIYTLSNRPPKPFTSATEDLFNDLKDCGQKLGIDITWKPSGGVCDGNILAQADLPTIDTFGAIGGNLHTHEEYILTESLSQRAHLLSLFLMQLAAKKEPL